MKMFSVFDTVPEIKIVDVGASDLGEPPSYKKILESGAASVIGFEPDETACKRLNEQKKGQNCHFLPYFIGDGKKAVFHETNWVATGSLFAPNTELLQKFQNLSEIMTPVAQHDIMTKRLDDITEIERIDLLKMDIQGGALSALQNAQNILKTTLVVDVEVEFVEMYKGQPLFSDVDAFMRSQGFQFHCFPQGVAGRVFKPFVFKGDMNTRINQHLWGDAIYVRDWMALDQLSEEQLVIYAVLVDAVLHSPDLANVVLEKLDAIKGTDYSNKYIKAVTGGG